MNYNLGGYSNQLNVGDFNDDDLNMALQNSGSSYQLEPMQAKPAAPIQPTAPIGQTTATGVDEEVAPGIATPSVNNVQKPEEEKKKGSALGKILGIVGSIYTGGATGALGAVGSATGGK